MMLWGYFCTVGTGRLVRNERRMNAAVYKKLDQSVETCDLEDGSPHSSITTQSNQPRQHWRC